MKLNTILIFNLALVLFFSALDSKGDEICYTPISSGELVDHSYYSLSYSEEHEQAEWVYYFMSTNHINGDISRTDDFRSDPLVSTQSAQLYDYKYSGYDRGHLVPAGDMNFNLVAMSESFYLSNMSPQTPAFNRVKWQSLENLVRGFISQKINLHIVTGPVFMNNKGSIGANEVTVPGYYYKIIYSPLTQEMVGFVLPNQDFDLPLSSYLMPVDSIEKATGIDFFEELEDDLENSLEATNKWVSENLIVDDYFSQDGISYKILDNDTCEVVSCDQSKLSVNIPEQINISGQTYQVVSVGFWAFTLCSELNELVIPENVSSICDFGFVNCSNLERIEFSGDAPTITLPTGSNKLPNLTIYYNQDAQGFVTPEWQGYPCFPIPEPTLISGLLILALAWRRSASQIKN